MSVQIADPAWETTFPGIVEPRPGEWLGGVLLRCDEVNGWDSGTTMATLVRTLHLDKTARSMSLLIPPPSIDLRPLAGWLAVSEPSLLATTYHAEVSRLYGVPHPHPLEASRSHVVRVDWIGLDFRMWRLIQRRSCVNRPFLHGMTSFSRKGRSRPSTRRCNWCVELLSKGKAKVFDYLMVVSARSRFPRLRKRH